MSQTIDLQNQFIYFCYLQEVKRKKTQIIKKNINPAFQESFNFKADENDIETIGVRVTAMQHMPFPEKGRKIPIIRERVHRNENFVEINPV